MAGSWYYARNGQRYGPFSTSDLQRLRSYRDGPIKAFEEPGATILRPGDVAALIAVNGGQNWEPAPAPPVQSPPPPKSE